MRVTDVMTTDLIVVDRGAAVSAAVERMLAARAGSAIVIEDDVPVGIVTNSDVLRVAHETGRPLGDIPVEAAMSAPLVTVPPATPVVRALQEMAEHDIKKLAVVEALTVEGIVTTTDIARQLPEHLADVRRIEGNRREWTGN